MNTDFLINLNTNFRLFLISNTIMLTKNEKHYDGLIFSGQSNLYLYLTRSNIFDNQIYVIYPEASVLMLATISSALTYGNLALQDLDQ